MWLLYNRKRAYILISIILGLIVATLGISYAINIKPEEKLYTIDNDGLVTSFNYPSSEINTPLELIKNEISIDVPSFNFTVKNTTLEETYYNILITINNEIDASLLPYIKVAIDKNEPSYLIPTNEPNTYEAYLGIINSKVAITHELKIYLSNKDPKGNELIDINYLDLDFNIQAVKSDYIPPFIKLLADNLENSEELFKDEHGNIRYYGINPNNYLSFNNELWRIIGIFKTYDAQGEEKSLIKLIRYESIGAMSIDYQSKGKYSNEFKDSSLFKILNEEGYWNRTSVACPNSTNRQATCDFTNIGLTDEAKNYLENVIYYQGGWHDNNLSPSAMYSKVHISSQAKNSAYVTLMDPSDYGYAAGPSFANVYLDSFDKSARNSNWLYNGSTEWLITPNANDYKKAYHVESTGVVVNNTNVTTPYNVRPVVYLKNELLLDKGTGSRNDPYVLKFKENS